MTISSYSLVLMVIHFLQCGVSPPVLPCLHDLHPNKFQVMIRKSQSFTKKKKIQHFLYCRSIRRSNRLTCTKTYRHGFRKINRHWVNCFSSSSITTPISSKNLLSDSTMNSLPPSFIYEIISFSVSPPKRSQSVKGVPFQLNRVK